MPSVGVVIPVKNGYPEIKECIEAILKQTIKVKRILVIDSGSTDGTFEYLQTIKEVELIRIPPVEFNHGLTRNIGWRHATEDFLFYTVQDAKAVNERLLEELIKGFTHEDVAAVCGQQIVPHEKDKNPVEWFRPITGPATIEYRFQNPTEFVQLEPFQKQRICGWDDVVAMYRTKVLKKIPFQQTVFGEDMIWAKEAILKGYALVYQQQARMYHYHLENPEFIFKRSFTTMYFRYKEFKLLPQLPVLTVRRKLSICKLLFLALMPDVIAMYKWYTYNITSYRERKKAYQLFIEHLVQGETVLDRAHDKYCVVPPVPEKIK